MGRFGGRRGVALVMGALMTASVAAQVKSLPRVAWVLSASAEGSRHIVDAMRAGLADEGLVDGRDVVLDLRYAAGRLERYPDLFADLLRHPVHVLVASGYPGITAARDASAGRIPVAAYFCGNDVKAMVESFARPGGNVTGISCLSTELAVKRVQILKETLPNLQRMGVLYDPRSPKDRELAEVRNAALTLGVSVVTATASSPEAIPDAIAALKKDGAEALMISEDAFTFGTRATIVGLAAQHRLPNIASFREFADSGGTLTYGASNLERFRQQGRYAAKMIRGTKPADLPIDQPMRFEFVINQKAAQAIGVTVPREVLLRADDVIR